jgi:hypothetical protein
MPLTPFQAAVSRLLSGNRTPDSYLAGGAALHLSPNSTRFSNDLDFFHDSEKRVAEAFALDRKTLQSSGVTVFLEVALPGYIRVIAKKASEATKIEWAHDSAWRFLPPVRDSVAGFVLHPVDLAVNKVLALTGRDEARDFLDVLYVHDEVLSLGALLWAAVGKDPGFTPVSILELVKRRGRYQRADFERLHLSQPIELAALKARWLDALEQAERFVKSRPPGEAGCLYYSPSESRFVTPGTGSPADAVVHFGRPGGVLPRVVADEFEQKRI